MIVLTNSFCIIEYVCIFWKLQILSFYLLQGLSFEHGKPRITQNVKYNSVALLLGYNQVFFYPEVLHSLPIYFPHIVNLCLYLESLTCFHRKDLIVKSSISVCTS